ncbi:MAG TPA: zinc ABC transporter ATP-binding protein ZnuC [Kiloniellales bacterium]|nr:zinc ABC transporter ATP-binding protein ZnuC [Kiloniellales bacterium]
MPDETAPGADAETAGALVAARGLGVRFGRVRVLAGVDLALHPGEIVSLIGPNGAGKTTLAKVLLGLIRPDEGTVVRRPSLRVGYVPQRFAVDRILPLTVRRFLALAGRVTDAEIAEALEEVEAPELIGRSVHALSGGEFQRALLARALLRKPELLVLDEPAQGVDIGGQAALYDMIADLRRRHGLGVLIISHDLHIVMAATDRVICLNQHICCSGAPEAVGRHPEYVALFGTAAARRLAVYSHEHDHAHDLSGGVVAGEGDEPREPERSRRTGP